MEVIFFKGIVFFEFKKNKSTGTKNTGKQILWMKSNIYF